VGVTKVVLQQRHKT